MKRVMITLLAGIALGCSGDEPACSTPPQLPEVRYFVIDDLWPFCRKIVAAVGELETEYEGKVAFKVLPVQAPEAQEQIERYDFGAAGHGLVGFDRNGKHTVTIPGHNYGKEEIVAKVEELLR